MSTTPRNNRRRKSSLLSKARWAGYAAAGAATALGTYEAAEAGITYSGLLNGNDGIKMNAVVENTGQVRKPFDFDNDGRLDLLMIHERMGYSKSGVYYDGGAANANPRGSTGQDYGAQIAGGTVPGFPGFYNAVRFGKGATIGASNDFFQFGTMASSAVSTCEFNLPGEGWLGFSFENKDGGTHYGWLRVIMDGGPVHSYSIMDWAYADPGEGILAGVPEPGSLGLLATGGIGLLLWRKRRANRKSA